MFVAGERRKASHPAKALPHLSARGHSTDTPRWFNRFVVRVPRAHAQYPVTDTCRYNIPKYNTLVERNTIEHNHAPRHCRLS
eukprot:781521-Pyramimonas_sp.AAC.1